jgi:hypothetical protein
MSDESKIGPGEMPENFLLEDAARDADANEKRFLSLERRIRAVEGRGALLPNLDEENIFFYLAVAYVVFGWVLPAVMDCFTGEK